VHSRQAGAVCFDEKYIVREIAVLAMTVVLTVCFCFPLAAQDTAAVGGVRGRVLDEADPVPGVRVCVLGSDRCADCHEARHREWAASPMRNMTRRATEHAPAGPFTGEVFTFKGETATMHRRGDHALVSLDAARTGEIGDGTIFVRTIDSVIRIRTGDRDSGAI
jgi:hypothetical protein